MYQVQLPLVIGIFDTWDKKVSHGPVYFYQPGYGYGKSFCSVKLCFLQLIIQRNAAVIFHVTEKGLAYSDKQECEDDVIFF